MNYQEAIDKAAKLLRKGNNAAASPEESAAFLAKAQQIISEYRLNVDDLDFDKNQQADDNEPVQDFGYSDPLDNVKYGQYRESWTIRLASVVADKNQCAIRYRRTEDKGSIIKVIGRPSDVAATRYLYGFFRQQIEQLTRELTKGNSSAFKGEFANGCIDTLRQRLDSQQTEMVQAMQTKHAANDLALVRVNNAVAHIEKRKEDVDDFLKSYIYETLAETLECTIAIAKLFWKGKYTEAERLLGAQYVDVKNRYDDYLKDLKKAAKGYRGSRGFDGAGARTTTGGRAAGQEAGHKIRMTGAKGSLGGGSKQIS